jgi:MtfA peptidase
MRWPWSSNGEARVESEAVERVVAANVHLARGMSAASVERLCDVTAEMVAAKRWESVRGFELTDEMRITIAANAAIPILELGISAYRNVQAIVVRPGVAVSSAARSGRVSGTYSDDTMATVGEAFPNSGPVAISWSAARYESRHPLGGRNVVIHEFAHKLDMSDGYTDGIPPLGRDDLERWVEVLDDEFDHVEERDSDAVLDPYAWTNRAEFFAVATETFFCRPVPLATAKPVLYSALRAFYRQDPALHATAAD